MRRALAIFVFLFACKGEDAAPAKKADTPASETPPGEGPVDAFTEYQRKSKTAEANVMLHRIATEARIAFEEERVVDGAIVPAGLPPSAPLTPEAGACCKQPGGKCPFGFAKWDHPAWQALHFAIDDPHYYSYEFESGAEGFVARAVGDLDCDGTFSKIELRGTIEDGAIVMQPISAENELD